jgi:outer membrane protein OmpA-like peptidoglycan-associated protein
LDIATEKIGLSLIVFDAFDSDVCSEITKGNAEIKRLIAPEKSTKIGLSKDVSDSYLYPISIREGKVLHFVLIADTDIREDVKMDFRFVSEDPSFSEYETKEFNFKTDDFAPALIFKVRDKVTGNPLVSNLIVKGIKQYEGIYQASDLIFDLTRNGKLDFYCEHEGYFFKDSIAIPVVMNQEKVILIELEPVRSGKTVQLEELDFIPGTSQFTEKSIPKLKRLNDFLVLNSMLNIEVQGHVFEPGESNSIAGQKMSEARAKRVMKYLLDNGISKERITAVGFGNTKPIYPFPKHYQEEQANRRVEILIK